MSQIAKNYHVVRVSNREDVLESCASEEAAEKLMILLQSQGEDVMIISDEDNIPETPDEFNIEGLELEDPSVDFGSELDDEFGEEPGMFDTDTPDIEFD